MAGSAETPIELVEQVYGRLAERAAAFRRTVDRPLTLAEKVLANHLTTPLDEAPTRGRTYVDFSPDRVAMQDATAQMALLQFMTAGLPQVAVPSTVVSRPRVWRTRAGSTDQPMPWREATRPSSRRASSALRTVTRLAPYAPDSVASLGSRRSSNSPAAMRRRRSAAICR